jgi:hypothetical protein
LVALKEESQAGLSVFLCVRRLGELILD